jgi:hypothetical protein
MTATRKPAYKIVKRDGQHFVFGYVGAGKYMKLSEGMTEADASATVRRYAMARESATRELRSWNGNRNRD